MSCPATLPVEENEEWRQVLGCSDYEVSNLGRVRSYRKSRRRGPVILIGCISASGYHQVLLRDDDGNRRNVTVHILVCEAWHGPKQAARGERHVCVRHLDGNKRNNRADNLRWGNPTENIHDEIRHGTYAHGENHPRSKLSDKEVAEIFVATGTKASLARYYGVSPRIIFLIKRGEIWRHITSPDFIKNLQGAEQ